jgi:hypothetical protein
MMRQPLPCSSSVLLGGGRGGGGAGGGVRDVRLQHVR